MSDAIRAVVVGADVHGLAAARLLARHGAQVTLIDRARCCGGAWLGFDVDHTLRFDRGVRFAPSTGNRRLDHALYGSLDLAWRRSPAPPTAGHVLHGALNTQTPYPDARIFGTDACVTALLEMHEGFSIRGADLTNALYARFGPTLTELVYRPLAHKLWGEEPEALAADAGHDLVPSRVVLTDRGQTARHMRESRALRERLAHPSSRDASTPERSWYYPARGPMSQWIAASVDDLERRGASVRLDRQIEGLERDDDGRVTRVRLAHGEGVPCDVLLWTRGVGELLRAARTPAPSAPTAHRDLALVHLLTDREPCTDLQIAQLYDAKHAANRAIFYRTVRARGDARERRAVTCEVPLAEGAGIDPNRLAARVLGELRDTGLMPADARLERAWVERETRAYTVRTPAVAEAERLGTRIAADLRNVGIVPPRPAARVSAASLCALDAQISELIGCAPVAVAA